MEGILKVRTEELTQQASTVRNQIGNMESGFDALKQLVDGTANFWIGEAGEHHRSQYQSKLEQIETILRRYREQVRDLEEMAEFNKIKASDINEFLDHCRQVSCDEKAGETMGKSARTILVEFRQVREQAKALEECAGELSSIEKQLQDLTAGLRAQWQGESADLYCQKCEELGGKLNNSANHLEKVSTAIRQAAKSYYDAEMTAVELAQKRTHGN